MLLNNKMKLIAVAGLTCAMSGVAMAAKGPNEDPARDGAAAKPGAVSAHVLAGQLIDYGRANKDALALIAAAQILKQSPARTVDQSKTSEGGQDDAGKTSGGGDYSADAALASAAEIAGQNPTLTGLIGDVRESSSRGRAQGPAVHRDSVRARATDVYDITYTGGDRAEVGVIGDGDTDLDLYVYDENGNLICKDDDRTDTMACSWRPRWTGPFRVKIKNLGNVHNNYTLLTN